jgi:mono/diheme cytochrome c family protein
VQADRAERAEHQACRGGEGLSAAALGSDRNDPMRSLGPLLFALLLGVTLTACPKKPPPDSSAHDASAATPKLAASVAAVLPSGSAEHGRDLVLKYECNRCHDGTGHPAAVQGKHCVHCHEDILAGRFEASAATLARWKPRVKELADAPSLEATGKRFARRWIEQYLLQPSDLRPHLHQYMPRLAVTSDDARDIAAYLAPEAEPPPSATLASDPAIAGADLGKGRHLLETRGCGSCHVMTGVAAVPSSTTPAMDGRELERAQKLAPDLRVTRERMTPARLVAWLADPKRVKPDSAMPRIVLTGEELKDLAGYLLTAELTAPPTRPKLERLPVLARKVLFKEVDDKVFHRTCWHCHSEPDYAIGDGGPGNSGGFGFKPRGLNLSAYAGIAAGFVDDKNERQSVFTTDKEGVPRLVRALLARHDEVGGASTGEVRGMPLGYDPLSAEEIQLVESWVAQGRPR